jgi:hypothetical protein
MECKITSTSRRRRAQAGYTLVEFIIASGVSVMAMTVFLALGLYTLVSVAGMTASVDLNARSRVAADRMSQKLRQISIVRAMSPTSLQVRADGREMTYTYNADAGTLVEVDNNVTNTLLDNVNNLRFQVFARSSPTNTTFMNFPVTTVTNQVKVLQVSWNCRRPFFGAREGAADMVAARVVLRTE